MNKLQLNELAPYLPFGLKAYFKKENTKNCRKMVIGTVSAVYSNATIVCHDTVNATPDKCFPILRPLSDLILEINGVVGLVELAKIHDEKTEWTLDLSEFALKYAYDKKNPQLWFDFQNNSFYAGFDSYGDYPVNNQYRLFEYLFKNHYDVFGLIEKKLAINANALFS